MKSVILLISIIVLFSNVDKSYQQLNACSYVSQFDSTGTALGAASIVASINECCLLCQVNAQCQSWTFACAPNSNQGYCFLKSSVGQLYPCGGRFTGVKNLSSSTTSTATTTLATTQSTTTLSSSTTTRAVVCNPVADTNYPGNDIPNQGFGNIATFQDCCNLCGANSVCTAFAYSTADRYCWLKSPMLGPGGTYNGPFDPYPGYISGSVVARRRSA